jgi:hypothetical protein
MVCDGQGYDLRFRHPKFGRLLPGSIHITASLLADPVACERLVRQELGRFVMQAPQPGSRFSE